MTFYSLIMSDNFALSVHIVVREEISLQQTRDGKVEKLEIKGDMNLQVSDPDSSKIKLTLGPVNEDFGNELQFKQHPNVAKFAPGSERSIALKDPSRSFPVNQSLAVLKWRYSGKDESHIPLSSKLYLYLIYIQKLKRGFCS